VKPLHVTLIHRESDRYRQLTGWWSYPVSEFTWNVVKVQPDRFSVKPDVSKTDLLVMDDWIFGDVDKQGKPLAYVTVDSARSDAQLIRNLNQSKQADLLLIDSDSLNRFDPSGKPVRRFAYAVNEKLFYPRPKEYDVAFLCWPTDERRIVQARCEQICQRHGWSFLTGTYEPQTYAKMIGSAQVVVHSAHVKQARSWRVFDVMASRGCLLTNPIPLIDGDGIIPGVHYQEYRTIDELELQIKYLLDGAWSEIAQAGYNRVMAAHTWRTRASELRKMVGEVLGL